MNAYQPAAVLFLAASVVLVAATAAEVNGPESVQLIEEALEQLPENPADRLEKLRATANTILERHPHNALVQEELTSALEPQQEQPAGKHEALLKFALNKAKLILGFKRIEEAKLPEGFPESTPVGELRVKAYPKYRLAKTEVNTGENRAFNVLFNHIKNNNIAMTVPVEMTLAQQKGSNKPVEKTMAFLYGSSNTGSLQQAGQVEVADVQPMKTISIGMRGKYDEEDAAKARKHLEAWLSEHADEYQAAGDLRVMVYNSPFVPAPMKYFEVEIPIERK